VHSLCESQSALFNAFHSAYLHRHLQALACISVIAGPITHKTEYKDVSRPCAPVYQTAVRPLLTVLTLLQCADPPVPHPEVMVARRPSVCLLQAVTDAWSTKSTTSLTGCNRAVRCSNRQSFKLCFQTNVFLLGVGYIIILSKCVKSYKCQSTFAKD